MKIRSAADLEAIREKARRELYEPSALALNIGLASCGMAAGAKATLRTAQEELAPRGIEVRQTGCLGFCEEEPLVEVFGPGRALRVVYRQVCAENLVELVEAHQAGEYKTDWILGCFSNPLSVVENGDNPLAGLQLPAGAPVLEQIPFYAKQYKVALRNCGYIDPDNIEHYIGRGGYAALWRCLTEMEPEEIIEAVTASGLRGRGGAGFPTGVKWRFTRTNPGEIKYVVVNADEGDPGAYMDRSVLEGDPHSVLEGLLIAARAIGASQGYIYVRHEYPLAVKRMVTAIREAEARGLLGRDIFGTGFDFQVKISTGAGAFVCGEETALMASIMGRRGMPRPRPPFPAQAGLWGQPTCINNVETMANVPAILSRGSDWFAALGSGEAKGTKVFSLVGKVRNTGLVEVPMGLTLREIVFDVGGGVPHKKKFKAVQTGGPSGGCIPASFLDTPVGYETLAELGSIMGSGGMIVMDEDTCMVQLARYFLGFLEEESCGQCTPCREGIKHMIEVLDRIIEGRGREEDIALLEEQALTTKRFSLCGLGTTAGNPVLSTIQYFREEYEAHILDKRCAAGGCRPLVISPCQNACPAGVDVPNYVFLAAEGRYREAWELIRERNPFPAVCGRICSHPCEYSCRRGELDSPVAIRELKRLVSDWALEHETERPEPFPVTRPEKMAVVGAGPAGLTCAYFLRQRGYAVTVFEASDQAGGMLRQAVPQFRLPAEVVDREVDYIVARGVEIRYNTPVDENHTPEDLLEEGFAAVFVSTGTPRSTPLGIEGAGGEGQGFWSGLDFLVRVRRGEAFETGDRVAVIGGGNVAVDAARTARRLGAGQVTIYYRRDLEEMPSSEEEIEEAAEEGVRFEFRVSPVKVTATPERVTGLVLVRTEPAGWDASGRRAFVPVEGSEFEVAADTVLVCVGQRPEADFGRRSRIKLDPAETVRVEDNTLATNVPGIFAGGDVVTGPSYLIEAIAAGRRAAAAMDKYVRGDTSRVLLKEEQLIIGEGRQPEPEEVSQAPRACAACLSGEERVLGFSEVVLGLTEEQAREEARRCLRCDLE